MTLLRGIVLSFLIFVIATSNGYAAAMINIDDEKYFDGFTGTIVLYDEKQDAYYIYNEAQAHKPLSPCSTFKIYNSLIGLETAVLAKEDTNTVEKWDGTKYSIESWNRDQTLASATQNSVVWYYQRLAARIGSHKMQTYLDQFAYGNRDISGGITQFWLQSSLTITAYEQVTMLRKLFSGKLNVSQENIQIVKKNIAQFTNEGISYYGKTGSAYVEGKWVIGWWVGLVETNNNRYFFATNIEGADYATGGKARRITENVLKQRNIL